MDFTTARQNMVECQLRTNKITDPRLLDAFMQVPREAFVPKNRQAMAYVDEDLAVGSGRYLMEPMIIARLLQSAMIAPDDNVLVVGAAPGYGAAVAGKLAASVFALESDSDFADAMSGTLTSLAIDNVVPVIGNHGEGYPAQAPYDVIILNGSVPDVTQALLDQVTEGGRLLAILQGKDGIGRGALYGKRNGIVSRRFLFDANVQPLPGFETPAKFVF